MPQKSASNAENNPFIQATDAYGDNAQKGSLSSREVEARVLLKAANMMQDLQEQWQGDPPAALEETLLYNRQIWMMFFNTASENQAQDDMAELRGNIINLSNFIFKREIEILSSPAKEQLDALISINRQISAGLMNTIKS